MGLSIAIVGATGAVGAELLKVLQRSGLPVGSLRLFATSRSAGIGLPFGDETLEVQETSPSALEGSDLVFISTTAEASRELAPPAVKAGAVVIDDSSAFRMEPDVPLVVPEINVDDLAGHRGIVSTPNCTAVPLVMALHPLRKANPLKRVVVDSYQAVSGAGGAAIAELTEQATRVLGGQPMQPQVFPHQIGFNVIPAVDSFLKGGYSKEEWKMAEETKKILHIPDLALSATCARVPVYRGHSVAAHLEFAHPMSPAEARRLLAEMPGVEIVDDPEANQYPMPVAAARTDSVLVGRIRQDMSHPNGLALWASADNLVKGAALNMVQIAEEMHRRELLRKG